VHVVAHVGLLPLHAKLFAHALRPGSPSGAKAHVPFVARPRDVPHAWQSPVHAVSQQTLSTQKPETQSVFALHVAP
jgi:hypothetical protein